MKSVLYLCFVRAFQSKWYSSAEHFMQPANGIFSHLSCLFPSHSDLNLLCSSVAARSTAHGSKRERYTPSSLVPVPLLSNIMTELWPVPFSLCAFIRITPTTIIKWVQSHCILNEFVREEGCVSVGNFETWIMARFNRDLRGNFFHRMWWVYWRGSWHRYYNNIKETFRQEHWWEKLEKYGPYVSKWD